MTIKEIRLLTGLSQAEFSKKYNIPKRTLQDWEYDKRIPPVYVVELLEFKVKSDFKNVHHSENE